MAILANYFVGDDEPAPDPSEAEIAELVALERETDDLEQQARDWLFSQDESEAE